MNFARNLHEALRQSCQVPPASFPASRDEVTPSWVIQTLENHPDFVQDPIETVHLSNMGDGIGQLSALILAELTCVSGRRLPLVIKLQAPVPEMHQVCTQYGHYESEVSFYREMAADIPLRTPEIYVCAMDAIRGRVVIIMEALGGWRSPDQLAGASADEVAIAIRELAGLASAYWDASPTLQFPWLRTTGSPQFATLPQDQVDCLPVLLDRFSTDWPIGSAAVLEEISRNYHRVQQAIVEGTQVLAHWDFRVENLFFGPEKELAVIDWQLMHMDNPANDLAYLLATNVETGIRREIEADMMALYLRELRECGVEGYGMAELVADYRLALLSISAIVVIGGANADIANPRSRALFAAMGNRLLATIEDWRAVDILRTL